MSVTDQNGAILLGLLFYGLFGAAGQIVRAIVALGGSRTLADGNANQQSLFNAAYFVVTLIVGFVAGLLAALVAFDTLTTLHSQDCTRGHGGGLCGRRLRREYLFRSRRISWCRSRDDKTPGSEPNGGPGAGGGEGAGGGRRRRPGSWGRWPRSVSPAATTALPRAGGRGASAQRRRTALRLEEVVAPTPLSIFASPSNSAAEVTVDMVCRMFPATPRAPIVSNLPFVLDGLQWRGSPTRKWFVSRWRRSGRKPRDSFPFQSM